MAPIEYIPGSFRMATKLRGFSPKYYANGWRGNQFAKTFSVVKVSSVLGWTGVGVGSLLDAKGVSNYYDSRYGSESPNSVHPSKASLNLGMGLYGMLVNPLPSIMYGGIDSFYPGGWIGASETATRNENQEQKMTGHPLFNNSATKF